MHTRNCYVPLLLLAVLASLSLISYVRCEPTYADNTVARSANHQNTLLEVADNDRSLYDGGDPNYDKRMERYAFGLGRRAYTYANGNGMKRLPVYNFGLGKRARPYSFEFGKRTTEYDEDQNIADLENLSGYDMGWDEKRNRPYSFGLGKRDFMHDDIPTKRTRYNFGLGRR